jgi:hypothetical protein
MGKYLIESALKVANLTSNSRKKVGKSCSKVTIFQNKTNSNPLVIKKKVCRQNMAHTDFCIWYQCLIYGHHSSLTVIPNDFIVLNDLQHF